MSDSINEILSTKKKQKFGTDSGTNMHKKMQRIVIDKNIEHGDNNIILEIKKNKNLDMFFTLTAKVEIPIAGKINNKFISRRIDRMVVDDFKKTIIFMDYKTDINKTIYREKYIRQMQEYKELLIGVYPNYKISGFLLWTNNWELEKVI